MTKNDHAIFHEYDILNFSEFVHRMVLADPNYLVREAEK